MIAIRALFIQINEGRYIVLWKHLMRDIEATSSLNIRVQWIIVLLHILDYVLLT